MRLAGPSVLALLSLGCEGRGCRSAPRQDPHAAEIASSVPEGRIAYVTNHGSDSLSVLDLGSTLVQTVSLDLDDRREAPHHVAVAPGQDLLYVALAHPRETTEGTPHAHGRSAASAGEVLVLRRSDLHVTRRDVVDESPGDLVLSGDRLLVTHFDLGRAFDGAARGASPRELFATLQVWQGGQKIAERELCVAPHGIAVRADGSTAYVACYGSDELALVDLRSPELATEKVPLGSTPGVLGAPRFGPYSVTLTPDESAAVVGELEGRELRIFDLPSGARAPRRLQLDARAMLACFSGGLLFQPLAAPDGLARIDVRELRIEARREFDATCTSPHVAACRSDGRVFVVCEGDHVAPGAVIEIDPQSLATRGRWEVGVYPDGIGFGAY